MKFKEHALAHQWLDGLAGLEIGAAAHNPFGLQTRNVGLPEDYEFYARNQEDFDCIPARVDIWGRAEGIPVPPGSEDFVISSHVIEHLPDVIGTFAEWNRIVRVEGFIFMIIPLRDALASDVNRPLTPLAHFIEDYQNRATLDTHPLADVPEGRLGHYHVFTPDLVLEIVSWMNGERLCDWKLVAREDVDTKVGNGFTLVFQIASKPEAPSLSRPAATADSTPGHTSIDDPAVRFAAIEAVLRRDREEPEPAAAGTADQTPLTVGLVGVFDINNYGDLLLPAIFRRMARQFLPGAKLKLFSSTARTDRFDGQPVHSLAELDLMHRELDAWVVGGGEMIRFEASVYVNPGRARMTLGERLLEVAPHNDRLLVMSALYGAMNGKPVVWNAPGIPHPFTPEQELVVQAALTPALYLSVRDPASRSHLEFAGRDVTVVPDSGFLVSSLFPRERLAPITAALKKSLGLESPYAVFHASPTTAFEEGLAEAAGQMRIMSKRHGIPVPLLPPGPAHDDVTFLAQMRRHSPGSFRLLTGGFHPLEIAALIAGAEFAVGTSLQCNITAFAYGVPGLAVNPRKLAKLDHFGILTGRIVAGSWSGLAEAVPNSLTSRDNGSGDPREERRLQEVQQAIQEHFRRLFQSLRESPARPPGASGVVAAMMQGLSREAASRQRPDFRAPALVQENEALHADLAESHRRLEAMAADLEHMNMQLETTRLHNFKMHQSLTATKLLNHRMQQSLVWLPLKPLRRVEQAVRKFRKRLFGGLFSTSANPSPGDRQDYQSWLRLYDTLAPEDVRAIRQRISTLKDQPVISVLMPVHNTPEAFLRKAIESVRAQYYEHWELCLADDASTEPHVKKVLLDYQKIDPRIKVVFRDENGHISRASNSALELATGAFTTTLDHDDELVPHALYAVANELNLHPDAELIYSDYDHLDELGGRHGPYFKSDWNPDLLLSHNFICHMAVYRTARLREVGGFRTGFEGSQDWDLSLRVVEKIRPAQIRHIPRILYHWRDHPESTALNMDSKPYAIKAAVKAIGEHLQRKGRKGRVSETPAGPLRVRYEIEEPPLVSIIICTRDRTDLLAPCVSSILGATDYPNYELLIVDNDSGEQKTRDYLRQIAGNPRNRVVQDQRPFNFSALNNHAASLARGDVLCFMNNDTEAISSDWLYEMTSHAVREEIGAVGAKLLYPDTTVQHAGVVLGIKGGVGHIFCGIPAEGAGYMGRAQLIQNYTAVTAACLTVRRKVFEEVGGFNETELKVAFSDIDLCLKIHAAGYRNLWTPYAVLYHHESASRGGADTPSKETQASQEFEYLARKWKAILQADPAYNPNLDLEQGYFGLAFPPRVKKEWA